MKYASKKEISAIIAIGVILLALGIKPGLELIGSIKPVVNLAKIAFAGFISFPIVGIIMAIGSSFGIWFGKTGGSILYAITLFIISTVLF